ILSTSSPWPPLSTDGWRYNRGVRSAAGAFLLAIVLGLWGCGSKHVRECDGGLEVKIAVPRAQIASGRTLFVELDVGGVIESRSFDITALDEQGLGSFVVHFEVS